MDTAVLESLARALEPATIEAAVQEAVEQERAARAGSADRRAALERELTLIDARTARLTEAVAAGGAAVGPLLVKLSEETTRRQAIERARGGRDALDGTADFATTAVRRALLRQASQCVRRSWPIEMKHATSCGRSCLPSRSHPTGHAAPEATPLRALAPMGHCSGKHPDRVVSPTGPAHKGPPSSWRAAPQRKAATSLT
jgi:hypothetical protein